MGCCDKETCAGSKKKSFPIIPVIAIGLLMAVVYFWQ
ncbi:hypothetical protein VFSR5_2206 [Aliivibrio fischeri SR5]|uniref:Uncharacterized protein n=1 Tax=Aliivibrio fischeri SR5 TaxID=1088719 RepID=A0AAV3ES88_ALIFS|nr:hypothetical protein VFSR5_2206 [Aliivibrio fischeri SR5]